MRRASLLLGLALLLPAAAPAATPFRAAVTAVATALHARPQHPHLMGTLMFFARLAHPHEAHGIHVALFDTPACPNLDATVRHALDQSWSRLVKTVSKSGEQALVYVRQDGQRFDMLVLSNDGAGQLALVTLEVNPNDLMAQVESRR